MHSFAITLVLMSTVMHAGWNLIGKQQQAVHLFFRRTLWTLLLLGLVPFLIAEIRLPALPSHAFWCVLGSSFCCACYCLSLANAYQSGDFTVVYPMARAIPVILVGLADMLRGNSPSWVGWLGMLLVVFGCLMVPLPSLRAFRWSHYINRTQMWIWLTALGTVGYTLLDKWAAEVVPSGLTSALRYGYLYFSGAALFYSLLLRLTRWNPPDKIPAIRWKQLLPGAACMFGAYGLVLWAYQLSARAGYIVAFRQFSIVIGVGLGLILFGEKHRAMRFFAACVICLGLVAIGVWG